MTIRPRLSYGAGDFAVVLLSILMMSGRCDGASLEESLQQVTSDKEEVRKAAIEVLGHHEKLSVGDGLAILRTAAHLPTHARQTDGADTSYQLISLLERSARPEYVPEVVQHFSEFPADGRNETFSLLEAVDTQDAAAAILQILKSFARTGEVRGISLYRWQKDGKFGDTLFPEMLTYLDVASLDDDIYSLFLSYCEKGKASGDQLVPHLSQVLRRESELVSRLRPKQGDKGIAWMYVNEYARDREHLAVLLDVAGFIPADGRLDAAIRDCVSLRDPRLKHFALISLLKHGLDVPAKEVRAVAANAEMRNWLYQALARLHRLDLYPAEYRTQSAFAESDMVYWLIYPTELGCAPDEIELMKVISIRRQNQTRDYYIFRFRTFPPHWAAKDGWMAGISGAFDRNEEPTPNALGDTFSSFDHWDSRSPEEHLEHRLQLNVQDRSKGLP